MNKKNVIVAGAGFAGIAAALSAARNDADVILIERYGFLGGMATAGLVHHLDPVRLIEVTGIAWELFNEMEKRGAIKEFKVDDVGMPFSFWQGGCSFDPEVLKLLSIELLEKAKIEILLHSWVGDVIKQGEKVTGVVVYNKSGRQEIYGNIIIDATGDADLAAAAGVPFELGDENGECMSPTLCFRIAGVDMKKLYRYLDENPDQIGNHPRLGKYIKEHRKSIVLQGFYDLIAQAKEAGDLTINLPETGIGMSLQPREGEFHVNATRVTDINPLDIQDLTKAELIERKNIKQLFNFMKKYIPGFKHSYIIQTAAQVGIRESRRIKGEYTYTIDDIKENRKFEDAVVRSKWAHTDVHSGKNMQWSFELIEGPYYIPYRAMVPKKVDNLLVAGRCISATRKAMASIRIMPVCASIGEAVGAAAAIASKKELTPRSVDIEELKTILKRQGFKL